MLPIWYSINWYATDDPGVQCTYEQRLAVVDGALYMGQTFENPFNESGLAGLTFREFDTEFERWTSHLPDTDQEAYRGPYFDSIWTAAMALNLTMTKLLHNGTERRFPCFSLFTSTILACNSSFIH